MQYAHEVEMVSKWNKIGVIIIIIRIRTLPVLSAAAADSLTIQARIVAADAAPSFRRRPI